MGGVFVVVPAYLAFLLLLKACSRLQGSWGPVATLMPGAIAAQDLPALAVIRSRDLLAAMQAPQARS